MPERQIKPIFVRLSEAERRRIRTLAVSQGLTTREAIIEAFEAWARQLRSGAPTDRQRQSASGATQRQSSGSPSAGRGQPSDATTGQRAGRRATESPAKVGHGLGGIGSV